MQQQYQVLANYAERQKDRRLKDLFDANPSRVKELSLEAGPLHFDFSKQPIDKEGLQLFAELGQACQLDARRDALFAGDVVNDSEGRPALHTALRSSHPPETSELGDPVAERVRAERQACYEFAEKVRSGELKSTSGNKYKHLIHIGIGGSYLGPKLLLESLEHQMDTALETHFVANIDGHALQPVLQDCAPEETLVIVVSKTFTTQETLSNARTVLEWLGPHVDQPKAQLVAITAAPETAADFGVPREQIFTFADWVGGRYSVWSSVSLAAMIALGPEVFNQFLAGAESMDQHFGGQPLVKNAPMLAGMLDFYFSSLLEAETRGVFPYDDRLHNLVPYLQQLEMESNGKSVTAAGERVTQPTCPVVWGGVGTDAQHAVFQLLHQGTHLVPTEFIAALHPDHSWPEHHRALLANCFAQSAALMSGRGADFPGNRPSTTILLDQLNACSLGALLAFYEHRTFVAAQLWQLNAFDQPGVQLGKEIAGQLGKILSGEVTNADFDPSTQTLLAMLKENQK